MTYQFPETAEHMKRLAEIFQDFVIDGNPGDAAWYGKLKNKTVPEAGLHVETNDKDKYWFSVNWPYSFETNEHYRPNDKNHPATEKIGVSKNRTNDAIRRDVEKRLLSHYYPILPEVIEKKNKAEARKKYLEKVMKETADLIGTRVSDRSYSEKTLIAYKNGVNNVDFSMGDETIKVKVVTEYLPLPVAQEVIKLLGQYIRD